MADDSGVDYVLWHYRPSLAGGVVACIAFCLLAIFHTWRLIRTRLWFCTPIIVGAFFETIGYAGRAAAHNDMDSITPYVIQSLLILLAPILFAASIYMILGRIIRAAQAGSYCLIRPNWVTKIFVGGDVFCFLMQSTGGGLLAKAEDVDDVNMGENIILGGLILQILIFGFFVVVATVLHKRLSQRPTMRSCQFAWQRYMWCLYFVSALITIRNVARCAEYGLGRDGYLMVNEWCLYVYDFALMFICVLACLVWYNLAALPSPIDMVHGATALENQTLRPKVGP